MLDPAHPFLPGLTRVNHGKPLITRFTSFLTLIVLSPRSGVGCLPCTVTLMRIKPLLSSRNVANPLRPILLVLLPLMIVASFAIMMDLSSLIPLRIRGDSMFRDLLLLTNHGIRTIQVPLHKPMLVIQAIMDYPLWYQDNRNSKDLHVGQMEHLTLRKSIMITPMILTKSSPMKCIRGIINHNKDGFQV